MLSINDRNVIWCENLDDSDSFESHGVSETGRMPWHVISGDTDGDRDFDVLFYTVFDSKLVLCENSDGKGNFNSEKIISSSNISNPLLSDMDGDEDLDIINYSNSNLGWYENLNGEGEYSSQKPIPSSIPYGYVKRVYSENLDNDNDMDILLYSYDYQTIHWYENIDGDTTFVEHAILDSAKGIYCLETCDMDFDGDLDIIFGLSWEGFEEEVAWLENLDGSGSYGPKNVLSTNAGHDIQAGDIDGDENIDIISVAYESGKIVLLENLLITGIENPTTENPEDVMLKQNYPNPFNPATTITFNIPERGPVSLKVYDTQGRELVDLINDNLPAGQHRVMFDGSKLASGIYVYTFACKNFRKSKKMILMR